MTDDAIKDQVKEATDIVAVIGQYVTLRRRGSNLLGLCPFHTEKSPSFNVNADRQFFHCFGCGKGGDVFTFLMEHEGWSFPETLKYCAEKAGITLTENRDHGDAQSRQRDEMSAALELADKIYRHSLFTPLGKHALDYLTKRGFKTETLKKAGVGYAPPSFDSVLKSGESHGISRKGLEAAGLIVPSQKGHNPYDRFRNRITFPIVNLSGKTVGFGARALAEEDQPKYLNSPETPLYQKSRILYGLVVAREAIRKENRAIIVEGYMDWLTMIEAGISNVVAVSGTALTDIQAKMLARFCERVSMMFDADAAGQRAALRGIDIAFNASLGVDIAVLPKGEDPDSFIRHQGVDEMRRVLTSGMDIVEYRIETERARVPGGRIDFLAQEKLIKEFGELADRIDDATRRSAFLYQAQRLLGVDEKVFSTLLKGTPAPVKRTRVRIEPNRETLVNKPSLLLRILLESPEYLKKARVRVLPEDFESPALRSMYEKLLAKTVDGFWPTTPHELGDTADEIEKWTRLLSYAVQPETVESSLEGALAEIAHSHRAVPEIRRLIEQADRIGDVLTAKTLLSQLSEALKVDKKEPSSSPKGK